MSRRRRSSRRATRDARRTRRHQSRSPFPFGVLAHRHTRTRHSRSLSRRRLRVASRTASTPAFSARNSSRSVDTPSLSPNYSPPVRRLPSRDRRAHDRCSPLARKNHTRVVNSQRFRLGVIHLLVQRTDLGRACSNASRVHEYGIGSHFVSRVSIRSSFSSRRAVRPNEIRRPSRRLEKTSKNRRFDSFVSGWTTRREGWFYHEGLFEESRLISTEGRSVHGEPHTRDHHSPV